MIFLDEPSTGLDPQSRLTMWGVVGELAASGVTVFLTTQYLEEAERLTETIAVLDGGRLIAEGTAAELKQRVAAQRLDVTCSDRSRRAASPLPLASALAWCGGIMIVSVALSAILFRRRTAA